MRIWIPPPPELGSGKFVRPCARMHSENLIPADVRLEFVEPPEEPHAANATAHPAPMRATVHRLVPMAWF